MFGTWVIAARNLLRNRKRNLATGSAIALGFAAMLALGGYINRVEKYLQVYTIYANKTGHIVVYAPKGLENYTSKPKPYSLSLADQNVLKAVLNTIPNVQLTGGQFFGTGLIGNGCRSVPFIGNGIDPNLEKLLRDHPQLKEWAQNRSKIAKGKPLSDYHESLGGIMVAKGLARILHKPKTYDEIPNGYTSPIITDCLSPDAEKLVAEDANVQIATSSWNGSMSALDAEVISHYDPGVTELANTAILAPLSFMQKLFDTDRITHFSIWLRNPSQLAQNMEEIKSGLAAKGVQLDLYPWNHEGVSPLYTGTMQFLHTLVNFLTSVLAVVVIFSIFNSATMTVIERSAEIGMMRSLGYKKHQISRLFLQEAALLTLLSLFAGGLIGATITLIVNHAEIILFPPGISGGLRLELKPSLETCMISASLIFSLALVATMLAIRSHVKKRIVDLLMGTNR